MIFYPVAGKFFEFGEVTLYPIGGNKYVLSFTGPLTETLFSSARAAAAFAHNDPHAPPIIFVCETARLHNGALITKGDHIYNRRIGPLTLAEQIALNELTARAGLVLAAITPLEKSQK